MFDILDYEKIFNDNRSKTNRALLCENRTADPIIVTNDDSNYDNENDYKIINNMHQGGTLVIFPQDIVFTWLSDKTLLKKLCRELYVLFYEKGLMLSNDGNDILFEGKKLFGTMSCKLDKGYYEGLFFSFNSDNKIISEVCNKKMIKIPISMPKQVAREELIAVVLDFCKNYNLELCGGED